MHRRVLVDRPRLLETVALISSKGNRIVDVILSRRGTAIITFREPLPLEWLTDAIQWVTIQGYHAPFDAIWGEEF